MFEDGGYDYIKRIPTRANTARRSEEFSERDGSTITPTRPVAVHRLLGDNVSFMQAVEMTLKPKTLLKWRTPEHGARHKMLGEGIEGVAVAVRVISGKPELHREGWVVAKGVPIMRGTDLKAVNPTDDRELQVTEQLVRHKKNIFAATPHTAEYFPMLRGPRGFPGRAWVLLESIPALALTHDPFGSIENLADVFMSPEALGFTGLLHVLFQVVWNFATLQALFPDFEHKDTHGENNRVTAWDMKDHVYDIYDPSRHAHVRFRLRKVALCMKLIDFGYAVWRDPMIRRTFDAYDSPEMRKGGYSSPPNAFRDMAHVLFMLHLSMQRINAPKWSGVFLRFVWDVIPVEFLTSAARNDFDLLNEDGNWGIKRSRAWTPAQMLMHPIFAPLRVTTGEPEFRLKTVIPMTL